VTMRQVAVIGAGVMGAGIAAHIANAGVQVLLLDIVPEGAEDRDGIAKAALAAMKKAKPAPFMDGRAKTLVTPGNIEDHLDKLEACDWIIEAVVERLDIKQALYAKIDKYRRPNSIVSSNTSTLPLAKLVAGLPERFARDFLITHFFNPPRYMRLLEIVAGPQTREVAVKAVVEFADVGLGKGIVTCNDTPGFVANRIGTFWIQCAVREAFARGLSVEEADALMGRPMGVPKTGVFALMDLVGIDLMPHVDANLAANLAKDDAYHGIREEQPLITKMIAEGFTGRKGKGGFYRLNTEGGGRIKEALNLVTGDYAPAKRVFFESLQASKNGGLGALVAHKDKGGQYAWAVLSQMLSYAASLVPEIADDIHAVDRAMELGYAWKDGPFKLIDQIGAGVFAGRLAEEGMPVPALLQLAADGDGFYRVEQGRLQYLGVDGAYVDIVRPDGVLSLGDIKLGSERLAGNSGASLWDIGDGVVCLEVHTKMNSIDENVLSIIEKTVRLVAKAHKALVIYNEGAQFSVGANLGLALFAANTALWPMLEGLVGQGQKAYMGLKYAPFPVVAAPAGMALGGGCEMVLHADAVQAHAETYIGLVEAGVGIVPGWGGCKELLSRFAHNGAGGPIPPLARAFETIGLAKVATSAFEAREIGFLRRGDGITFNRDRLLADAKAKALALTEGYQAPEPIMLTLPGPTGKAALGLALHDLRLKGVATDHDMVVADELAGVLSGGEKADITEPVDEKHVLRLEREAFMRLVRTEATLARMEHMLETGKPLRN